MVLSRSVWWVVWRQQRFQVVVGLLLLAVLTCGLLLLHLVMDAAAVDLGLGGCEATASQSCNPIAVGELSARFGGLVTGFTLILLAAPPLFGALSGAPLFAREHENGTQVLVLSQSVSTTRWWFAKYSISAFPIAFAMLVVGFVSDISFGAKPEVASIAMTTPGFETRGVVLSTYFLLACTFAATVGVFVRNTAAVVGLTVAAYAVILLFVGGVVRPHYVTPETTTLPLAEVAGRGPAPDDWVLGKVFMDTTGGSVTVRVGQCGNESFDACLSRQGVVSESFVFHPADTFWSLQAIESSILLVSCGATYAVGLVRLVIRVT